MKLIKKDLIFDQYAVHARFEGVDRGDVDKAGYINIYFLPIERGWVWQIPLTDQITSIGVVTEKKIFRRSKMNWESYFNNHVQTNASLTHALHNARRINEFMAEGDYSYSMTNLVGNGYLLIGDAARFVDPIFASGISVALYSAKYASESIKHAYEIGDFSVGIFKPYEDRLRKGIDVWYEFIRLYYKLMPLFTYFLQSRKHGMQIIQLLQGEVFDRTEVPVLDAMREFVNTVEKTENHMFREHLSDIPIDEIP